MSKETQNNQILRHLLNGGTLTTLQAKSYFNCTRLASRISELGSMGYIIARETIKTRSRKRVSRYSMEVTA